MEKTKKEIKKGENFGELALNYDVPSWGTIKTLTDCYMWIMEKRNFKKKLYLILLILHLKKIKNFFKVFLFILLLNMNKKIFYLIIYIKNVILKDKKF